ncbi:MAG: phosphatidate cytidylyltransferase [Planctomycetota bacterium]
MLRYRLIFGPILILALLAIFWLDSALDRVALPGWIVDAFDLADPYMPAGVPLFALFMLLVIGAGWELTRIFRANNVIASTVITCFAAEVGLIMPFLVPGTFDVATAIAAVATAFVLMFIASLLWYSHDQNVEGVVAAAGGTMFAMLYLGVMPHFFLAMRQFNGPWLLLAIVLITKSCDIGAYFTGRAIGRHKLIPWLSPGKTWEGLFGGLVFAGLIALLLAMLGNSVGVVEPQPGRTYDYRFNLGFAFVMGMVFGLFGQAGDLLASLLKRDAGIKDSSRLLPGFGGVLDVLDSPILVAPLAYWVLRVTAGAGPAGF